MSWSEIPMELFCEISKRLDLADVVRSEKVCMWWRSMQCRKYARKSQVPWLMLPWLSTGGDDKQIQSRYFYSLTGNKIYELYLPEIAGRVCIGSSHGYLFSIDYEADLIASNPLVEGAYLPLPSTSTFPCVVDVIRDSSSGRITNFETMIDGILRTSSLLYMMNFYYKKVILSPAADTVAVIYGSEPDLALAPVGDLAFARVGDQSWTVLEVPKAPPYVFKCKSGRSYRHGRLQPIRKPQPYVDDIIFHKGCLHAVYVTETLAIFDLDHPAELPFMSLEIPTDGAEPSLMPVHGSLDEKRYLVQSPCGGKLFLVRRYLGYITGSEFRRTKNFKIYVLDEATYTWNRTENLGDVSLFLGFNCSTSFCTSQFPSIKRNCIYFSDDHRVGNHYLRYADMPEPVGDMGVFHLDDETIGSLYPGSNLSRLIWPPPIFFMPTLQ